MKSFYFACLVFLMGVSSLPLAAQSFMPQSGSGGPYMLVNHRSGQALEIGGGDCKQITIGSKANQYPYFANANQQWYITYSPGGGNYLEIISRASGFHLEIGGGRPTNTYQGTLAQVWSHEYTGYIPNGTAYQQQWTIDNMGGNLYRIVNRISGYCLEIGGDYSQSTTSGREANQYSYYGNDNQLWEIVEVPVKTDNIYQIVNANSGKSLEVACGSYTNGASVQQWDYNYDYDTQVAYAHQEWYLHNVTGNYYSIINRNSNQVLEIGGDYSTTVATGALANQYPYNGNDNQLWEKVNQSDGTVIFYNKRSRKVLEIGGYSTSNGGRAQQWDYTGTNSQRWRVNLNTNSRRQSASNHSGSTQSISPAKKASPFTSLSSKTLPIFPNPARTTISLSLSDMSENAVVKVLDAVGAVTSAHYQGNGKIDVANLAPGMYLVVVFNGVQEHRGRFIKE